MGSGSWSLLKRYGLAAVLTALAILASLLLAPHWNPRHLLLPFYPAVMLSAWFGGFGPGLLTTLLSALAIDYFWLPPTFAFGMQEPGDLIGFVLFLGVGLLGRGPCAQRERALPRSGGVAGAGGRSRPGRGDLEPGAQVAAERPHASERARQRPRSGGPCRVPRDRHYGPRARRGGRAPDDAAPHDRRPRRRGRP